MTQRLVTYHTGQGLMNPEVMNTVVDALVEETDKEITPDEVTAETLLREDFELDSMQHVSLVMALEDNYGIEIDDEELVDIHTVGDLVTLIETKRKSSDTV